MSDAKPDLVTVGRTLETERAQTVAYLEWLRGFGVVDDASMAEAGKILQGAARRMGEIEALRETVTRPLLEAKKAADALFAPMKALLAETTAVLKDKVGAFTTERENARRALMVQSAATHAAGGLATLQIPEPAQAQGVTVKKVWDFELTDPEQVPRFLCSPDARKIKSWMVGSDKGDGPGTAAGIRFYQREAVRVQKA